VKDFRQTLLATFQVEHQEHVQRIRESLRAFEQSAHEPAGAELDDVFRRAHSLKGAARAVDLRPIEHLAHRLETLFARIRSGQLRLDRPAVKVIDQVLDASEDWLASAPNGGQATSTDSALAAIDAFVGDPAAGPGTGAAPTIRRTRTRRAWLTRKRCG
jgi:two-component system chemotaxis sensor kinase CheA